MALVIVATAGDSDANSYLTLEEAETFVLEFLNTSTWSAATTATKNAALVQATHLIDCLPLLGTPYGEQFDQDDDDYQPLHFPITENEDDESTLYIPDDVKRATVAQALYLIRAGEAEQATHDTMASGVSSHGVGRLSQQFNRNQTSPVCPEAKRYLTKWLTSNRRLDFA